MSPIVMNRPVYEADSLDELVAKLCQMFGKEEAERLIMDAFRRTPSVPANGG